MNPIVEPTRELSTDDRARYSRQLALGVLGEVGQRRLASARVLSIGAGGLGSVVLQYLAAAGIGTIGVVDDDQVERSNLQRQVIHADSAVGRLKVDSAAESIARANPAVRVNRHPGRLTAANAVEIVSAYDVVVDGSDNFATRYLVNDACAVAGIPDVWGSVMGFEGQVSVFWQQAPDGLARTYRDLHPQPPPEGVIPSCADAGVLGSVCGVIGSVMATEALKLITGIGNPLLGRVMVCDSLSMSTRQVPFRARGDQPITEIIPIDVDELPADESVSTAQLRRWMNDGALLVDIREPYEAEICRIAGSVLVPQGKLLDAPQEHLEHGRRVVLYCKTGGRSGRAVRVLRERGWSDLWSLDGGVLAWIRDVDDTLTAY